MATDQEIAALHTLKPIGAIAERAGIPADALSPYGKYKAKIDFDFIRSVQDRPDGALVLALCMPAVPTRSSPSAARSSAAEEDALENWRLEFLHLGPRSKRLAARLVALGVPEVVVALCCSRRVWAHALLFAAWCLVSRALSRRDLGPPFVLFSIVTVMVLNLGTRGAGQLSAYSLFNPGVQALPGATSTDELDTQIRAGLR